MRRGVLAAVTGCAVLAVLAGCSPEEVKAQAPPAPAPAPAPAGNSPAQPRPADGINVRACYDGTCEIEVKAGLQIPMDGSLGVKTLVINQIGPEGVAAQGTAPGLSLRVSGLTAGESDRLAKVSITPVRITGGRAVIRLAPA